MNHWQIQVTGGWVSSELTKLRGWRLLTSSHITPQICLCHSSNKSSSSYIVALMSKLLLINYICVFVRALGYQLFPYLQTTCFRIMCLQISYLRLVLASVYKELSFIKHLEGCRVLRARNSNIRSKKKRRGTRSCKLEKKEKENRNTLFLININRKIIMRLSVRYFHVRQTLVLFYLETLLVYIY